MKAMFRVRRQSRGVSRDGEFFLPWILWQWLLSLPRGHLFLGQCCSPVGCPFARRCWHITFAALTMRQPSLFSVSAMYFI